ncbi:MAG: hypothetical protein ABFS18_06400 [Thermodesulfobacteriota bacterium]
MKKSNLIVAMSLVLALIVGCNNDGKEAQTTGEPPQVVTAAAGISGTIAETMDASGYTYVSVDTGTETVWVAGPKTQVKVGDEVFISDGSPINNFESKTLGRTFETILFASSISVAGAEAPFAGAEGSADKTAAPAPVVVTDFSGLAKPEGGKTVADIFAEKTALNGQNVKMRAKVTKFMSGIMGKNWLHIKDGTGAAGADDLVVTTQVTAAVGDTVLVSGTVAADKDFGSGYKYAVIVEDAEVTIE